MKVRIVIPIENIEVETGIQIKGFTIIKGHDFLYNFPIDTRGFRANYGNEVCEDLTRKKILYYEGEVRDNPLISHLAEDYQIAGFVSEYFTSLFALFWFKKDCSIYVSNFYVEDLDNHILNSKYSYDTFSDKKCEFSAVNFSVGEIYDLVKRFDNVVKYLDVAVDTIKVPIFQNGIQPQASAFMNYTFSRIVRATDFLHFARNQFSPIIRITFLVAIYECLFTSGTSELTHQVSERASLFIGGNREDKQANYQLLKDAYKVRSSYIHGDTINKPREYFLSILDPLDELTRKVFNKVLDEPGIFLLSSSEGDKKKFEQYFKDLIFQ